MPEIRNTATVTAPSQLSLFADTDATSVVLFASVNPSEFKADTASLSRPDNQRHRWLLDQLAAKGFRIIRHTFHPPEIAHPWECEETLAGTVIYRQWPEPD